MFARMGNIKAGLLEDPESGESLNNVESALSGVGIKLRDSSDQFRNFGDVLNDIASRWNTYSNVEQRAIGVALGGTRQQEKVLTLFEHFPEALKYTTEATESAGTALNKYSNSYLSSVQAAQDRATASFENLSNTVLNSDLVAGTFNAGSGLLDFLTKFVSLGDGAIVKFGLLITASKLFGGTVNSFFSGVTKGAGRHRLICLTNMPANDLVVTRNEFVAYKLQIRDHLEKPTKLVA